MYEYLLYLSITLRYFVCLEKFNSNFQCVTGAFIISCSIFAQISVIVRFVITSLYLQCFKSTLEKFYYNRLNRFIIKSIIDTSGKLYRVKIVYLLSIYKFSPVLTIVGLLIDNASFESYINVRYMISNI